MEWNVMGGAGGVLRPTHTAPPCTTCSEESFFGPFFVENPAPGSRGGGGEVENMSSENTGTDPNGIPDGTELTVGELIVLLRVLPSHPEGTRFDFREIGQGNMVQQRAGYAPSRDEALHPWFDSLCDRGLFERDGRNPDRATVTHLGEAVWRAVLGDGWVSARVASHTEARDADYRRKRNRENKREWRRRHNG